MNIDIQLKSNNNRIWAEKLLRKIDPSYRYRWEQWSTVIKQHLTPQSIWADLGCGDSSVIGDLRGCAGFAVGIDKEVSKTGITDNFIRADIHSLPIPYNSVDVATLRFVIEHVKNPREALSEIGKTVKPGGYIMLMTTNRSSPYIFIPSFLPFSIKSWIISILYKINNREILPTFHNWNTDRKFNRGFPGFKISRIEYLQDINYVRRWIFLINVLGHILTDNRFFMKFRPIAIVVYKKISDQRVRDGIPLSALVP